MHTMGQTRPLVSAAFWGQPLRTLIDRSYYGSVSYTTSFRVSGDP